MILDEGEGQSGSFFHNGGVKFRPLERHAGLPNRRLQRVHVPHPIHPSRSLENKTVQIQDLSHSQVSDQASRRYNSAFF
jgi:hypothetical protein